MAATTLWFPFAVLAATSVAFFLSKAYRHRSKMNNLRIQGMPMPKGWTWLLGHFTVLMRHRRRFPVSANIHLVLREIAQDFPDEEMFLLDLWPVLTPSIVVFNPEAAVEVTQRLNLPRTKATGDMVLPITGGPNLLSMNGPEWKVWRTRLNQGFSAANIMEHVPHIVEAVEVFCATLREKAEDGGIICLDDYTTRLTFEVIMKVTLDAKVDLQRSEHVVARAFGYITRWHSFWDPRILLHPFRPFIQAYFGHVINSYVRKQMEHRFLEVQHERSTSGVAKSAKSIISLAMDAYITENENKNVQPKALRLDDTFVKMATHQIRLFLFAGNDTTSSTIVFTYHILSQHPTALSKMRAEHDQVFGPNIHDTPTQLKQQPALLNQCRYTRAVIKEVLRLYPPAATMRQGLPGVTLTTRNGSSYPVDDLAILVHHQSTHRNPRLWPHPNAFLPERWLVEPGHELYPAPGAYRPFEAGPRNCIGQSLTLAEIKIAMVLTVRGFDIRPAYEEWDDVRAGEQGLVGKMLRGMGVRREEVKMVDGDRVFQTEQAGTHPSEGYPCRISLVR